MSAVQRASRRMNRLIIEVRLLRAPAGRRAAGAVVRVTEMLAWRRRERRRAYCCCC
jgi:hypothetical protein